MAQIREFIPLPIRRALGGWWHRNQTARQKQALLRSLRGDAVTCNVCNWTGAKFADDQWHPGTICPNCGSQVRHRMLAAILDGHLLRPGFEEKDLLQGRRVLHFAPERQLRDRIQSAASSYTTADFDRGDCDLRIDISSMPSVASDGFDVVIACDVLEHVPDDEGAFREIHRILVSDGVAILTVPQRDPPSATDEDPVVVSESARFERFGQKDHVRMYGDDFAERVSNAGFSVVTIDASHFDPLALDRHVLHPPIPGRHALATNHRRVYLARKRPR